MKSIKPSSQLESATVFIKRFRFIIFFVLFGSIYAYLLMSIGELSSATPSINAVNEELKTVKRLNIDQDSIDRMLRLSEENIEVKTLFEEARNNPFAE